MTAAILFCLKKGFVMNDTRNLHHFGEPKKLNTKIKHYILSNVLQKSISIANNLCQEYKNKNVADDIYTYIDLFAGRGSFDDGSKGSPLIALDNLSQHQIQSLNKFSALQMVCTEKNYENYKELEDLLSNYIKTNINCYTGQGDWESYSQGIQEILKNSAWGFIFADPYSTELDITALKKTLKKYSKLKDMLVFFNFRTLARQEGRGCIADIGRICKNIGIDESELLDDDNNFSIKFETKLKEHFGDLKSFVIGVGFPTEVKGKLINDNYFYLIFSTNSPVLVDYFLAAYEEMLCEYTDYNGCQQMPIFGNPDKNYIFDVIKEYYQQGCSLYELYKHITDRFLSWKELTKTTKKVPTLKNVIAILNEFNNEGSIFYQAPLETLYKRKTGENYEGNLKYLEAGKSAAIMKKIQINLSVKFR